MTPRKMTRMGAALVVPALLFAAACGSDDSSDSDNGGGKSAAVTKVTGDFGKEPKMNVPDGAKASDETVVKTLAEGKGDKVGKGDQVRLDFAGKAMKDGQDLGSTWAQPAAQGGQQSAGGARQQVIGKIGEPNQSLPPDVLDSVAGHTVGSRLLVEGTAGALVGENLNPESGIGKSDGLAWVIDVVAAGKVDAKAELKGESAEPREGMPEIEIPAGKAAKITIPDGDAPKELQEQVLIEGKGAEVKAGQGLIAQYTGYAWEDGKKFDSSWDNTGATAFQIGTGSVVEGWDKALVGKKVGDRVLVVIPPELGYGKSQGHELEKKTLVFVVDILGTV